MEIFKGYSLINKNYPNPILTIGNFDGVHKGHQKIFQEVKKLAQSLKGTSIVYTFFPHPLKVIGSEMGPPLITTFVEKLKMMELCGIDIVICENFTKEFAGISSQNFVKEILIEKIRVKEIIIGNDYRFGKGREGDAAYLKKLGDEYGFNIMEIPTITLNGTVVRSSVIRKLIKEGDIEKAGELLGRNYVVGGEVIEGKKRGKGIGFPTANIKPEKDLLPPSGIYAVWAFYQGNILPAVVNIGYNPTFQDKDLSVEVYILDFNQDMYHHHLEISFVKKLREEKRFSGSEELALQIKKDVEEAGKILKTQPKDLF
ncbi:MAG: bifunctional riboflavin kinase/FAD synthetase [Thermodesulfobacteriota bacterium]|nr:bifunctional riboflavin kinase/FAD synthetase [Thermodesulfobacteriota bacterium]